MHSVTYYGSYGVVLAVVLAGALLVIVAFGAARLIAPRTAERRRQADDVRMRDRSGR